LGIKFYHLNHLGSVEVISTLLGTFEQVRYTPYGTERGHYDGNGNNLANGGCSPDGLCREFTQYDTEPISGLEYAGARFYDPALGSFLTHDPAREFASPYSYVNGDPVNATDPNGQCGPLCFVIIGFVIGFALNAITAAANGASAGEALKAGAIGGGIGAVTAGALGIVGNAVGAVGSPALSLAYHGALVGAAEYGALSSHGVGQVFAVVGVALSIVDWANDTDKIGAQPAQGGNGAGGRQFAAGNNSLSDASNDVRANPPPAPGGSGGFFRTAGRVGLDVVGKLWALPNTIIGGVVGLAGVPFGAQIQFGNNAIQFVNFPLGEAGEGLTLGNVQIFPAGTDPATYSSFSYGSPVPINIGLHEEGHTFQYQVFGPAFLPAYALSGGISASNPFELAANRYALGGSFLP